MDPKMNDEANLPVLQPIEAHTTPILQTVTVPPSTGTPSTAPLTAETPAKQRPVTPPVLKVPNPIQIPRSKPAPTELLKPAACRAAKSPAKPTNHRAPPILQPEPLHLPEIPPVSPQRGQCMLNSFATVACAVQTGVKINPKEPSCALSKVPLQSVYKALSNNTSVTPSDVCAPPQEPPIECVPSAQVPQPQTNPKDVHAAGGDMNLFNVTISNISALFLGLKGEVNALKTEMLNMSRKMAHMQSTIDCLTHSAGSNDRLFIPPGGKTDRTERADGSVMLLLKKSRKRKLDKIDTLQELSEERDVDGKPTSGNTSCRTVGRGPEPKEGMGRETTVYEYGEDKPSVTKRATDMNVNRTSREIGRASQGTDQKITKRRKGVPLTTTGFSAKGGENGMEGATGLSVITKNHEADADVGKTGPGTPTTPNGQAISPARGESDGSGSGGRGSTARGSRRGSGKRKRDNWTEDENNEFMRLVIDNASMEEMELRRMLTRQFQPRRSHEQCANHLRILRAQSRLPAANEETVGVAKANN